MGPRGSAYSVLQWMPRQEKTPKKKSKKKSPQKSEESKDPAMDQAEMNRLLQNAIEHVQAELQQKHEERIKALEACGSWRSISRMRTAIKLWFQRSSGTLTGLSCFRREKGGQGHVKFKTSGRASRQSAWTVPSKTDWSSSANYSTVNTPILLTYLLTYPTHNESPTPV